MLNLNVLSFVDLELLYAILDPLAS